MLLFSGATVGAQPLPESMLQAMRWRLIGPFRGGRVTAVTGIPGQPEVYYMGTPGGGVWKTDDAGRVWRPIFDAERVASIGAVAVSASNPNIVYVGTGEQTQGNGMYISSDAGVTWSHIGLEMSHLITQIKIDPANADILVVAAQGDATSGNQRGVFKSSDGGHTWHSVLYVDNSTGAADLATDPDNPSTMYATMIGRGGLLGRGSAGAPRRAVAHIYQSTDEGSSWTPTAGSGLPVGALQRMGVAVAPGTHGKRVFAIATEGLYRSDDGAETFTRCTSDPRITSSGYICGVYVDPKNADNVYVPQTSMYRSTDGGSHFESFVGAPSGDDFHVMWINPQDTRYMILGVDQGAVVSVNAGSTWSSWYNQPTGQFYHVTTDKQFPYNVYGAQQDSGTACIASRSDYGEITYRDWAPVGGMEFAYIEPDPLHPNLVYTTGWYGSLLRYDKVTGQITHVLARSDKYRTSEAVPIAFSILDPHTLYAGTQYILKTRNGGVTWQQISPDVTAPQAPPGRARTSTTPSSVQGATQTVRRLGVVSTISVSPVKRDEIWAGTTNGVIQLTTDGKNWHGVYATSQASFAQVSSIEASHHDSASAYAVIRSFQATSPTIYRTHDFGKTWQPIANGFQAGEAVEVVREDPVRRGLLYAGTTTGVYCSLNDGDSWQSLQLNLPTATVTDLTVHGADLIASTYGRSIWILDDIAPLRQAGSGWDTTQVTLLNPEVAVRTRWDVNQDTPLPPETPTGKNPPEGAIVDYYLPSPPTGQMRLDVYDSTNRLVREITDTAQPYDPAPPNVPDYWFGAPVVLPKQTGLNRFAWDLRYSEPKTLRYGYFGEKLDYIEYTGADHAIPGDTPRVQPPGPLVAPGRYTLALTVDGKTVKQQLTVTLDPRVHVSQRDLESQVTTAVAISNRMAASYEAYEQIDTLERAIVERERQLGTVGGAEDAHVALHELRTAATALGSGAGPVQGVGPLNRELARIFFMAESGDARPAGEVQSASDTLSQDLAKRLMEWRNLNLEKIGPVNTLLARYHLQPLPTVR